MMNRREAIFGGSIVSACGVAGANQKQEMNIYSPLDFGAVGDGSDESVAIQSCIDAAPDNSHIYLPLGQTFGFGSAGLLMDSRSGLVFTGGGTLKPLAETGNTLPDGGNSVGIKVIGCNRSGFDNVRIDGNGVNTTPIGITGSVDCFVDRSEVFNFGNMPAIHTINNDRTRISNNHIHSGNGQGIWLGNYGVNLLERDVLVYGNTVIDLNATAIILSSAGGRCFGNHAQVNGFYGSGIAFGGANGFHSSDLIITNNRCIRNPFHGIQADSVYSTDDDLPNNIVISSNICAENNGSGIYGVQIANLIADGNSCYDNGFTSGYGNGIHLGVRVLGASVTNNTCYDTRSGAARSQINGIVSDPQAITHLIENVTIQGNTVRNNASHGIHIAQVGNSAKIDKMMIADNRCVDNGGYGLITVAAEQGDFNRLMVVNNMLFDNTVMDLRVSVNDAFVEGNLYAA